MPLHQNGFVSATEMVSALIDTFHLEPINDESGQQWKVVDILHSDVKQPGAHLQPGITVVTSACLMSTESLFKEGFRMEIKVFFSDYSHHNVTFLFFFFLIKHSFTWRVKLYSHLMWNYCKFILWIRKSLAVLDI